MKLWKIPMNIGMFVGDTSNESKMGWLFSTIVGVILSFKWGSYTPIYMILFCNIFFIVFNYIEKILGKLKSE